MHFTGTSPHHRTMVCAPWALSWSGPSLQHGPRPCAHPHPGTPSHRAHPRHHQGAIPSCKSCSAAVFRLALCGPQDALKGECVTTSQPTAAPGLRQGSPSSSKGIRSALSLLVANIMDVKGHKEESLSNEDKRKLEARAFGQAFQGRPKATSAHASWGTWTHLCGLMVTWEKLFAPLGQRLKTWDCD